VIISHWRADERALGLLRHLWRGGWGHLWQRPGKSYWINPQELGHALARLDDRWATDAYFGVHPAASAKGAHERARAEDIVAASALFADFDADDRDPQTLLARIEAIQPAPSVIVASGGGYHAYWLLAEPVALADEAARADWAAIQRWWVRHVGADPAACDLARLLRVPGTMNGKYDPPRPVQFVRCDLGALHDNAELLRLIADARAAELDAQERGRKREGEAGEGPIARYNRETDIRDALREFGYTVVGERYFARPGKDPRQGISGTIDVLRNRAYTFSTHDPAYDPADTSPSGGGCTLRPFDLLCRLRFGGDVKAAVRWLIESGRVSMNGHVPRQEAKVEAEEEARPQPLKLAQLGAALAHQPATDEQELHEARAGELLAQNFGARLRYAPGRGWLAWDGRRWREDADEREAAACAWQVGGAYLARALQASRPLDKQFLGFGKRVLSAQGTRAVLEQGRKYAPIAAYDDDFDRDPWVLNTPSGIVDLRTGELRPHDPAAMLTRVTRAPYDPQAEAPRWRQFLLEVFGGDAEVVAFVRRWLGYCLTGDMREQRYVVAWGAGANGKSTLFDAVRHVMGDYATDIPTDALAMRRSAGQANPDIAKLPGVRLAVAPEWDEAVRADETLLKSITGGDPITARYLFRNPFTFRPCCKIVIFGNAKPALRGTDTGTWRRPILLPFTQQFSGTRADKELPQKLQGEAAGILADLVRGCLEWQREGLRVPASLEEATREWREENDDVQQFIAACCVRHPQARATVGALHAAYKEWGGTIRTPKAFGAALRERGFTSARVEGRYVVMGLGLQETR